MNSFIDVAPLQRITMDAAIWYANMNDDQAWHTSKYFPVLHDPIQAELVLQQEQQLLWIADRNDTVWFRHMPDEEFLSYIEAYLGQGRLPNIYVASKGLESGGEFEISTSGERAQVEPVLIPFLLTDEVCKWSISNGWKLLYEDASYVQSLNDKYKVRRVAEENGFQVTKGYFCHTPEELEAAYYRITQQEGYSRAVLKSAHGSSGKGLSIIDSEQAFRKLLSFIRKRATAFELLLEAWHPIERSLNAQLYIDPQQVCLMAITEQCINDRGVYVGTNYTPDVPTALRDIYEEQMLRLGRLLQRDGYFGVIGVDSIVDELGDLYPIIEINGRFTQVTYLLPFVQDQLRTCSYVESRYIRLEAGREFTFNEIVAQLNETLQPDTNNSYVIYTFAAHRQGERWYYRMFLLFCGQEWNKLQRMITDFEHMRLPEKERVADVY